MFYSLSRSLYLSLSLSLTKTLQGEECGRSVRRTVDIGLDISVVQHLTSDAVVPGYIPGTNHTFSIVLLSLLPPRWRTRLECSLRERLGPGYPGATDLNS